MGEEVRTFLTFRWQIALLGALPMVLLQACRQSPQLNPEHGNRAKPPPELPQPASDAIRPVSGEVSNSRVFADRDLSQLSRQAFAAKNFPDNPDLKLDPQNGTVSWSSQSANLDFSTKTILANGQDSEAGNPTKASLPPPPSPESAAMYPRGYYGH